MAGLHAVELEGKLGHDVFVVEARIHIGIRAMLVVGIFRRGHHPVLNAEKAFAHPPFRRHLGAREIVVE